MFQNERFLDALIRADRYQAEQTRLQMRTIRDANHGKGDITTNGMPARHTDPEHCGKTVKFGWI